MFNKDLVKEENCYKVILLKNQYFLDVLSYLNKYNLSF